MADSHSPSPTPSLADWQRAAAKAAPGGNVDALAWHTPDGIVVKPLYTAEDVAGLPNTDTLPGFPPYVRGPQATMYAGRPWTIRQYAGFSTAEESNAFYRQALAGGGQGVSVAFDLATHRGYDSDHPRVVGDVGKAGVAIDSVEDMKILFDGIPLDKVSVSMTMNGAVLPVLAGYIVAAEEQGVAQERSLERSRTTSSKSSWCATPTSIRPSRRCASWPTSSSTRRQRMPKFNSISISGYHIQEAGANQALELAFTLADGREYVRLALARGMDVDAFAGRLSFFFGIGMNFYLEIAKLRAARLLWHRIMQAFAPKNPKSSDAAHALPDLGLVADRAGSVQQHRAHHDRGDGRGLRRHAVAAHQQLRRGGGAAHRLLGAHRAQHAGAAAGGNAHRQRDRSLGRLLHDGEAHPGHGRSRVVHPRGDRGHGRHDARRRSRDGPSSGSRHRPRRSRRASIPVPT